MDLANLNAFIAVAETRSFSLAAERLHLTQPAVSKRIAALEAQLDVRLFDRLGRAVSLTAAGRDMVPRTLAAPRPPAPTRSLMYWTTPAVP